MPVAIAAHVKPQHVRTRRRASSIEIKLDDGLRCAALRGAYRHARAYAPPRRAGRIALS